MNGDSQMTILITQRAAMEMLGLPRSTYHLRRQKKLLPESISLGPRTKRQVQHEIEAIAKAMIAGKTEDELRDLFCGLLHF